MPKGFKETPGGEDANSAGQMAEAAGFDTSVPFKRPPMFSEAELAELKEADAPAKKGQTKKYPDIRTEDVQRPIQESVIKSLLKLMKGDDEVPKKPLPSEFGSREPSSFKNPPDLMHPSTSNIAPEGGMLHSSPNHPQAETVRFMREEADLQHRPAAAKFLRDSADRLEQQRATERDMKAMPELTDETPRPNFETPSGPKKGSRQDDYRVNWENSVEKSLLKLMKGDEEPKQDPSWVQRIKQPPPTAEDVAGSKPYKSRFAPGGKYAIPDEIGSGAHGGTTIPSDRDQGGNPPPMGTGKHVFEDKRFKTQDQQEEDAEGIDHFAADERAKGNRNALGSSYGDWKTRIFENSVEKALLKLMKADKDEYEIPKPIEPSPKAPQIDLAISRQTGKSREQQIAANQCMTCDKPADKFTDDLSRKEYGISGMCQDCQDKAFAPPPEEKNMELSKILKSVEKLMKGSNIDDELDATAQIRDVHGPSGKHKLERNPVGGGYTRTDKERAAGQRYQRGELTGPEGTASREEALWGSTAPVPAHDVTPYQEAETGRATTNRASGSVSSPTAEERADTLREHGTPTETRAAQMMVPRDTNPKKVQVHEPNYGAIVASLLKLMKAPADAGLQAQQRASRKQQGQQTQANIGQTSQAGMGEMRGAGQQAQSDAAQTQGVGAGIVDQTIYALAPHMFNDPNTGMPQGKTQPDQPNTAQSGGTGDTQGTGTVQQTAGGGTDQQMDTPGTQTPTPQPNKLNLEKPFKSPQVNVPQPKQTPTS